MTRLPYLTNSIRIMKSLSAQIEAYKNGQGCKGYGLNQDLKEVRDLKNQGVPEHIFLERCICNRQRHQQRLRKDAVATAVKVLMGHLEEFSQCEDFECLYDMIYNMIARKKSNECTYISYSTVYDTALRIAYSFDKENLMPRNFVYVHQHLVKEANDILGRVKIENKCRIQRNVFEKREKAFAKLNSTQIEDFLCVRHLI